MIRIYSTYKPIEDPWGGANSFLRSLRRYIGSSQEFTMVESPDQGCDIILMNQLACGPGQDSAVLSSEDIKKLRTLNPRAKTVVRAVNLKRHSAYGGWLKYMLSGDFLIDRAIIQLLNHCDHVIFQSAYQHGFFLRFGYKGSAYSIIHNGAAEDFVQAPRSIPKLDGNLMLLSSTASKRQSKRHDLMAGLSRVDGVQALHAGAWPDDLDPGNVQMLGIISHEELLARMGKTHYFLHPAQYDPCPNAMFEALAAGLPVIHHEGPGSSKEIAGEYGIIIDETDPAGTIKRARDQYQLLSEKLAHDRERYSIAQAAQNYLDLFRSLCEER